MERVFLVYCYKDSHEPCSDIKRVLMGIFHDYDDAYEFAEEYCWESDDTIEIEAVKTHTNLIDYEDNDRIIYKGGVMPDKETGKLKLKAIYLNMEFN